MTERQRNQLWAIGLMVAIGVPLELTAWILAGRAFNVDVTTTCHFAGLSSLLLLTATLIWPLLLPYSWTQRLRGFVIVWFVMSVAFNFVWELPLVVFKPLITTLEVNRANLPKAIVWWSYTLCDSHYFHATPLMITIELWWLLANAIAVGGLVLLRRGRSTHGHLLLGVAGALQAYNASLYVVGNGVMDHYANITGSGIMPVILYWGFNLLWTLAAAFGSLLAFRFALADHR
jgi:hypothetical protein